MKRGGTNDPDLVDLMGSNRSIQPLDELMVIREARYLSGNDLGKTIAVGLFDGILVGLDIAPDKIILHVSDYELWGMKQVKHNTPVTITGKESSDNDS